MPLSEVAKSFFKSWDVGSSRVERPRPFIFLCGGKTEERATKPTSVREEILRNAESRKRLLGKAIILAEEANQAFEEERFQNLLSLEEYIGAIAELVLLIVESPGAIAELGSFVRINELREKLFVIVRQDHYGAKSFIKLGPVLQLEGIDHDMPDERKHVKVYDWEQRDDECHIDAAVTQAILEHVGHRLSSEPRYEKIDLNRIGHCISLCAAICFILRGGKLEEIREAYEILGHSVQQKELKLYIFVLDLVGWIGIKKHGSETYFIPQFERLNIDVAYNSAARSRDAMRWISDIASELMKTDKPRLRLFAKYGGGSHG